MINYKLLRLQSGETFITSEKGNSMIPLIHSDQKHEIAPCTLEQCNIGDVVYCKVKGRFLTHKVIAKNSTKGALIANNSGRVNGWTKNIYGRVINIF